MGLKGTIPLCCKEIEESSGEDGMDNDATRVGGFPKLVIVVLMSALFRESVLPNRNTVDNKCPVYEHYNSIRVSMDLRMQIPYWMFLAVCIGNIKCSHCITPFLPEMYYLFNMAFMHPRRKSTIQHFLEEEQDPGSNAPLSDPIAKNPDEATHKEYEKI
ncbi:hypothetical protein R1flu_024729 [Riccia fluitans]|uniref:Uncharacterized protein n=1 Tax=Riccia fluitans TaxID=41844 RepID=A0ABD1XVS0_9MARC